MNAHVRVALLLAALAGVSAAAPTERAASFDGDPGWEGHNNRPRTPPREVRQDFGYSRTAHAGGEPGEIGGFVTPVAEPAYYALRLSRRTLRDRLSVSGTFASAGREFHVLVGFFNSRTLVGWRTPNTLALRFYGRGDVFYAYLEYATSRWRAGADSPRGFTVRDPATGSAEMRGFASRGAVHRWSLTYDPDAAGGRGAIAATIDDQTALCELGEGHQQDGATFDRFGLLPVLKQVDGAGEVWLDDVTVDGRTERFDRDPGWDALGNRRTYRTGNVRPRFDFGFSPTRHAGGRRAGEIGGLVYRGDSTRPETMAFYADRIDELGLDGPLRASGRLALRHAVSDSTALIGFFHSRDTLEVEAAARYSLPRGFVGAAIEGPSAEGFLFYPVCRLRDGGDSRGRYDSAPHVYPDGAAHGWSLEFVPTPGGGGRLTAALDGRASTVRVPPERAGENTRLDRFGIVTTAIDGNAQVVYFDDLRYTARR